MPNFSLLVSLEVAEKFVGLTQIAMSNLKPKCIELELGLGYGNKKLPQHGAGEENMVHFFCIFKFLFINYFIWFDDEYHTEPYKTIKDYIRQFMDS